MAVGLGNDSSGTVTQSGGLVVLNGAAIFGRGGGDPTTAGTGTFLLSGGTFSVVGDTDSGVFLGWHDYDTALAIQNGGFLNTRGSDDGCLYISDSRYATATYLMQNGL